MKDTGFSVITVVGYLQKIKLVIIVNMLLSL